MIIMFLQIFLQSLQIGKHHKIYNTKIGIIALKEISYSVFTNLMQATILSIVLLHEMYLKIKHLNINSKEMKIKILNLYIFFLIKEVALINLQ